MAEPNDPRVYFASERTLLAWIRTGISVMGLGFVVARFGLFLEAARYGLSIKGSAPIVDPGAHLRSLAIGVSLLLLGGASTAFAAWQHRRLVGTLSPSQLPAVGSLRFAVTFAFILAAVSALLAAHLLFRSDLALQDDASKPTGARLRQQAQEVSSFSTVDEGGQFIEIPRSSIPNDTDRRSSEKQKLAQAVKDALLAARFKDYDIEIDSDEGVVVLKGSVAAAETRSGMINVASSVDGVRDVRAEIEVNIENEP